MDMGMSNEYNTNAEIKNALEIRFSALLSYNINHISYALDWLSHVAGKHATQLTVDITPLQIH